MKHSHIKIYWLFLTSSLALPCFLIGQSVNPAQIPGLEQQLAATTDAASQAAICNDLSVAWSKKDPGRSLEYADKAFDLAKTAKSGKEMVKALNLRGDAYVRKNDDASAERAYNDALERLKSFDDPELKGRTLHNFGKLAQRAHKLERAKSYYEQAVAIRERIGDKPGLSSTLQNLGVLYSDLSDLSKSNEYYNKALALKQELGDKGGVATVAGNMATNYLRLGNFKEAENLARIAIPIQEEMSNMAGLGTAYGALATAVMRQANPKEALPYFQKAIDSFRSAGNQGFADEYTLSMCKPLADLGRYEEANKTILSLLEAHPEGASSNFYLNAYFGMAQLKAYQKLHAEELEWEQKAMKYATDDVKRSEITTDMAGAYVGLKQYDLALKTATEALNLAQKAGAKGAEEMALFQQAEALYYLDRFDEALQVLEKEIEINKKYNIQSNVVRYQTLKSKILTAQLKKKR